MGKGDPMALKQQTNKKAKCFQTSLCKQCLGCTKEVKAAKEERTWVQCNSYKPVGSWL